MEQCSVINRVWPHLHRRDQPKLTISQPCRNHGPNPDISLASRVVLTHKIVKCTSSSLRMKGFIFQYHKGNTVPGCFRAVIIATGMGLWQAKE